MSYPILEVCNISKWFGKTRALSSVNLGLSRGEVHVLAGENGAGKSTLIRILSGAVQPDEGTLSLHGKRLLLPNPVAARKEKIVTIHQELSLIADMSVADNLFLGERGGFFGCVDARARHERARHVLQNFGLEVEPSATIRTLPLGTRQLIEIARALAARAEVVIFDEPTSALSQVEAQRLFEKIAELRRQDAAILYISHRMEEIYALADRISVLRDGQLVASESAREMPRDTLVRHMIGKVIEAQKERTEPPTTLALSVTELTVRQRGATLPALENIAFDVHERELLGVYGLQGSGASELLRCLAGSSHAAWQGKVDLFGRNYEPRSVLAALARDVVLLPGDRGESAFADLDIVDNVCMTSLDRFSRCGWFQRARAMSAVEAARSRLPIAARDLNTKLSALSGGNQQKVLFLRCLLRTPKLLLLDEPTRGIDIGAKHEIYTLLGELVQDGASVLWFSSELDELLEQCDRVLVLARGRVRRIVPRAAFSRAAMLAAAMGQEETAA